MDNISTIFIDIYKDQLKSERVRIVEYPFDKYFDQQVRELEDNATAGFASEAPGADAEARKDPLVSADNGGPPPPPVPGLLKGMPGTWFTRCHNILTLLKRSLELRTVRQPLMKVRRHKPQIYPEYPLPPRTIYSPPKPVRVVVFLAAHGKLRMRALLPLLVMRRDGKERHLRVGRSYVYGTPMALRMRMMELSSTILHLLRPRTHPHRQWKPCRRTLGVAELAKVNSF